MRTLISLRFVSSEIKTRCLYEGYVCVGGGGGGGGGGMNAQADLITVIGIATQFNDGAPTHLQIVADNRSATHLHSCLIV